MKTPPRWTRSAISQAKVLPKNWRYGFCETHVGHKSRNAAKRAIKVHMAYPCGKCSAGMRIDYFVCPTTTTHFHIGHRWPAQGEQSA